MNIEIRSSVFETNSSSSHSIEINELVMDIDNTLIPDKEGVVYIEPIEYEFGRHWDKFNDAATKACYYILDKICKSDVTDTDLGKVICNQTGATKVLISENILENGYIDHQSSGNSNNITDLHNYIFNTESYLYIGNDESEPPLDFYDGKNDPGIYEFYLPDVDEKPLAIFSEKTKNSYGLSDLIDRLCSSKNINFVYNTKTDKTEIVKDRWYYDNKYCSGYIEDVSESDFTVAYRMDKPIVKKFKYEIRIINK